MADIMPVVTVLCKVLFWIVYTVYCSVESLVLSLVPRRYRRKDIKGKIVLITGGGSGIGRHMCLKMAAKGAVIVTWDINHKGNEETLRQVVASGGKCRAYTVDLCDRNSVYTTAAKVKQEVGKVDILINNAGVVTGKKLLDCADESIVKTFEVNTISHFWTTKAFLPDMMISDKGHIVTIASMAGKSAASGSGLVDYCSSKFGAVGFDEALRMEVLCQKKHGIKTTVVCPIQIDTGMFKGFGSNVWPFNKMLDPDWVAEEVVDSVLMNETTLILPSIMKLPLLLNMILPEKSMLLMAQILGADRLMEKFVGRRKAP